MRVRVESRRGSVEAVVEIDESMLPGVVSLPHGNGLAHVDPAGRRVEVGPRINRLTASDHCDPLTKTPFHKTVPVRLQVL